MCRYTVFRKTYLYSAFATEPMVNVYGMKYSWVSEFMWQNIDVQADRRRSCTYGRAPNAIDIS